LYLKLAKIYLGAIKYCELLVMYSEKLS